MLTSYSHLLDLIGNTPLIKLRDERVFAKAEFLNPGGSIKDRIALAMLAGAERRGELKPGAIIVEPTSGNTGIGVALVGQLMGYAGADCHAGRDERGAQKDHPRAGRRIGADAGLREYRRGGALRAGDGCRRPAGLRPPAIREPGQPPRALRMHRRGTLAADGRGDRLFRRPASAAAARCRGSASF